MKLQIKDLHVSVENKEIIKGLNLELNKGEVHAVMGPNGSGKSTLAFALMGHPKFEITKGAVLLDKKNVLEMKPNERAKAGMFLSFQYPAEISGVSVSNFLKTALEALQGRKIGFADFKKLLKEKMELLRIDESFADRYVNEGFSGGEKKRLEILQMSVLNPNIIILDETDSGLDIDSLKTVADGINKAKDGEKTFLIITHYKRILDHVKPDKVQVMRDGRIVMSGGYELVDELEKKGYEWIKE